MTTKMWQRILLSWELSLAPVWFHPRQAETLYLKHFVKECCALSCNNIVFLLLSPILLSCQGGDVMLYIHRCTCLRGYPDGTTIGLSKRRVWVVRHTQGCTMYIWCPVWRSLATESWEVDFFQSLYPRGNLLVIFYCKKKRKHAGQYSDLNFRYYLKVYTLVHSLILL